MSVALFFGGWQPFRWMVYQTLIDAHALSTVFCYLFHTTWCAHAQSLLRVRGLSILYKVRQRATLPP